jgi:hypothetical protein
MAHEEIQSKKFKFLNVIRFKRSLVLQGNSQAASLDIAAEQ